MICVLKAVVAWIVLTFVGTNLIGSVVRGLFWAPPSTDGLTGGVRDLLARESKRFGAVNAAMTLFWAVVTLAYLGALYHFWNIALVITAVLAMLSRVPDLLWEIRNGRKLTGGNMPRGAVYYAATAAMGLCLPLAWFALYDCK
jgi:hypothetical protein